MQFGEREIAKVVLVLNGHINFWGSAEYDEESVRNIRKLGNLIDYLIDRLAEIHSTVNGRQELSAEQIDEEIEKVYKNLEYWVGSHEEE